MWHHVALRLLWYFEVPDGDATVCVTTYELLAFVVPADRTQRLHVRTSQTAIIVNDLYDINFSSSLSPLNLRCNTLDTKCAQDACVT